MQLATLPRMADFATWIVAAEPALPCVPGTFLLAYQGNRANANESAIESSVLSVPLLELMDGRTEWKGTATELKDTLEQQADERLVKSEDWPKKPHLLSGELKRIAPNLRRAGMDVEFGKVSGRRFVRLTRSGTQNSAHSVQSVQTCENAGETGTHEGATGRTLNAQKADSVHENPSILRGLDAVDAVDAELQRNSRDVTTETSSTDDVDWAAKAFE